MIRLNLFLDVFRIEKFSNRPGRMIYLTYNRKEFDKILSQLIRKHKHVIVEVISK